MMKIVKKITGVFKPSNVLCLIVGIVLAVVALYCIRRFATKDLVGDLLAATGAESFEDSYEDEPEMEGFENDEDEKYEDEAPEKKTGAARLLDAVGIDLGQ